MTGIHSVLPREVAGRDMTLRVNMQHQAAAFAALQILQGKDIDRVYCDYQDDFVVRHRSAADASYHFFQVKTKGKKNHQWSLLEVFSIKKSKQLNDAPSLEAIRESIAGRLVAHAITFGDACREATLLTNVHFSDDVEAVVSEFQTGSSKEKSTTFLRQNFASIFAVNFDELTTSSTIKKLSLQADAKYMGDLQKDFAVAAREAIYKFSEIDLEHQEADEIAVGLISLVNKKSTSPIRNLSPSELDDQVGVGLVDLLAVLSISTEAYGCLLAGEDPKALKTASVIQRKLKTAGATDGMIEFASQKKVDWDIWWRSARHIYPEFDLNFLLLRIESLRADWMIRSGTMQGLRGLIDAAANEQEVLQFSTLTKDHLFGGVIAAFVRRGSA